MRIRLVWRGLLGPALLMVFSACLGTLAAQQAYQYALDRGAELLRESEYEKAIEAYKDAERLAPAGSVACHLGLAIAYNGVGATKNAARSARKVIEAEADPEMKAMACNQLGRALFAEARGSKKGKLQEAEQAFRQAIDLGQSDIPMAAYNLGLALLQQERDEEGIAALKQYLEMEPEGLTADRARQYIDDPRRARENFAPDFTFVTLDGEYLRLEDLRGKAVLIDFWATWCRPCRDAIPHLRLLSRKMEKEPFVIVGVSADNQESAMRAFVESEDLTWPQYFDERGKVARLYEITSFPTYVILDHEGIVVFRYSGWSESIGRAISSEVSKAVRKAKKAAKQER